MGKGVKMIKFIPDSFTRELRNSMEQFLVWTEAIRWSICDETKRVEVKNLMEQKMGIKLEMDFMYRNPINFLSLVLMKFQSLWIRGEWKRQKTKRKKRKKSGNPCSGVRSRNVFYA